MYTANSGLYCFIMIIITTAVKAIPTIFIISIYTFSSSQIIYYTVWKRIVSLTRHSKKKYRSSGWIFFCRITTSKDNYFSKAYKLNIVLTESNRLLISCITIVRTITRPARVVIIAWSSRPALTNTLCNTATNIPIAAILNSPVFCLPILI